MHEFYSGPSWTNFDNFEVIPTLETVEILRHGNCLFKKSGSGFQLLCEVDGNKNKTLKSWVSSKPNARLVFHIKTLDQQFHNVTSLLEVRDIDSDSRIESTEIYQFIGGHAEKPVVRLWEATNIRTMKPACIVIVPLGELLTNTAVNETSPRMVVSFKSRSVYWRYNIARDKDRNSIQAIVDRKGEIDFVSVDQSKEESHHFSQFISQQKIILKARYELRLELREQQSDGREVVLIDRLPFASPEKLSKAPIPGSGLVADIYVN